MEFRADLHIHSKHSRACSRDCDLEHLALWAGRKGIALVGTGDFTHPAWRAELGEKLVPAEEGLFRLAPEIERSVLDGLPPACQIPPRFMLSVEISTIYKRDGRTRKVHHLLYAPSFAAADAITGDLARIGNLASDGRPILGLDSRDLLEITLNSDPGSYLVPAHVWTPWFAVLGSKSGFDRVADCYADLADHVFAIETGLSSDPSMNWTVSSLDRYTQVSNSDAHSPPMLAREATRFTAELGFTPIRRALETGRGFAGTLEFFPEHGKYHTDGHRACDVRRDPDATRAADGRCPVCGRPLTVGTAHRVSDLADRPPGYRPDGQAGFVNLVPLPEIVSEIAGVGPKSKRVQAECQRLAAALGPELEILLDLPEERVRAAGGELLGEAVARLRRGEVRRDAGYDGVYGTIRMFDPDEISAPSRGTPLFDLPAPRERRPGPAPDSPASAAPRSAPPSTPEPLFPRDGGAPDEGPGESGGPSTSVRDALVPDSRGPDAPPPAGRPKAGRAAPCTHGADRPEQKSTGSGATPGSSAGVADARTAAAPADGPESGRRAGSRGPGSTRPAEAGGTEPPLFADAPPASPAPRLLDGLDPEQRAAASAPGGPLLVVAGPGTGKTRTLTRRIAHLVAERGVPAEQFLALTFTRKAAGELRERLAELLGSAAEHITATTFHGLGLLLLRELHGRAGLSTGFGVAGTDRALAVAAEATGSAAEARKLLDARGRPRGGAAPPEAEDRYTARLRELDLVDFADLVRLPVELLAADTALAAHYRRRWPWISVDEFQDVDADQYALLSLLSGPDGNLTAIGDPDQAIYAFRGSDVGFFLAFAQDRPAAAEVRLSRNYRSNAAIVDAAIAAIAPSSLVPGRALRAVGDFTDPPRIGLHTAADPRGEAAFVARSIDRLLGGTSHHSLDSGRVTGAEAGLSPDGSGDPLSFADFAVLYRTSAQAEAVAAAFDAAGVPFAKRTHDRLADRPGVRALAAELPLVPGQDASARVDAAVQRLLTRIPEAGAGDGTADAGGGSAEGADRVAVRTAASLVRPLAERCGADLDAFLAELALGAEVEGLDPRADRVALLTLHAAKGLEFPVVFLVGCDDGTLPFRLPGGAGAADDARAEEERRLFFVGMTRARDRLYLSRPARRGPDGGRDRAPSPFLADLPGHLTMPVDAESAARRRPQDRQLRLM